VFQATAFEYRFRYWIHALIYVIGFCSPWEKNWFRLGEHTAWVRLAAWLAEHHWLGFSEATITVLVLATALAILGAWLRTWGASYLGAATVLRGDLVGNRIIADGPYRHLRNPLYLGTILHTLAVAILMRPAGAIITIILLIIFHLRLIGSEEPFLTSQLGPVYTEYCKAVPSLLFRIKPRVPPSGLQPRWMQGLLSEVYMIGTAISFAALGWAYSSTLILQGLLVSLGLSFVARAFISQKQ